MAEKLCELKKKGGGGGRYTETSLWTNSAPTSSFTGQTVTLSESMDNFKYLKIKYAFSTSLYADANCNEIVIPVADFKKSLSAANGNALIVVGGSSSTTRYTRFVFYQSDTGVQFGHSVQFQTSTTNDNTCIPLEILGINELDHGKNFDETSLWTNANPTSNYSATDITLSDDVNNYDYIKFVCRYSTSSNVTLSELCTLADFKSTLNTTSNNMRFGVASIATSVFAARCLSYISDTSARISAAFTASGTDNSRVIPLSVVGCKFR